MRSYYAMKSSINYKGSTPQCHFPSPYFVISGRLIPKDVIRDLWLCLSQKGLLIVSLCLSTSLAGPVTRLRRDIPCNIYTLETFFRRATE